MQSLGRHALLDLYGCDTEILNDVDYLRELFRQTAIDLKATVIDEKFHNFTPHGVSGVVVIAESHLAVHTWPEHGYAAVDLFTCSEFTELPRLSGILRERLEAREVEYREISRGEISDAAGRRCLLPRVAAAT